MRCSGLSLTTRSIRRASILSGTAAAAMPRETPHHPTKTGYLCIYTILVLVEQNKKQIFLAAAGGRSGRRIPGAPMYPGGGWNRICWGQARKKRGRKRWVLAPAGTNERTKEGTTVCSRMWEYLGLFSLSHTHSPLSLLFSSLELPLSTPNSPEVSGLTPPAAALPAALLPADPPARSTECRHSASRISPAGGADPNWRVSLWLAPSPAPAKRRSLPADAAGRGVMCGSEHGRDRLAQ